ncbi:MAG: hypothetical protein EPN86_02410 [Nanoarchaeota archaeon]|nr:MAG: hypothetical protein EPN86_02410 [Nanoarchaeota archaeon]
MSKFNWNDITWDDPIRDRILETIAREFVPDDVTFATHEEVMSSGYDSTLYKIRFLGDIIGKQVHGKFASLFWGRQTIL